MSTFAGELIHYLSEALAHAQRDSPAIVNAPRTPREARRQAKLTQARMAPRMGRSRSGYRGGEQGTQRAIGPAAILLGVVRWEPEADQRALL